MLSDSSPPRLHSFRIRARSQVSLIISQLAALTTTSTLKGVKITYLHSIDWRGTEPGVSLRFSFLFGLFCFPGAAPLLLKLFLVRNYLRSILNPLNVASRISAVTTPC
jgi:hypothetical protein